MVIGGPARWGSQETGGSPRFLGNPWADMPRSSTPVDQLLLAITREVDTAFQPPKTVGPTRRYFRGSITRPIYSLSTLHRVGHPSTAQDSLPACWLSFGWTGLSPVGFRYRISMSLLRSPFPTIQACLAHSEGQPCSRLVRPPRFPSASYDV